MPDDRIRRTNIELDARLVAEAMELYGTTTMRETVDLALRRLVGARLTSDEALALEGTGWEGDLDAMRADAVGDTDAGTASDRPTGP
jgi:Arc/MetJ family transcription regulator